MNYSPHLKEFFGIPPSAEFFLTNNDICCIIKQLKPFRVEFED